MDKNGNICINGRDEIVNFLTDASEECEEDVEQHFKDIILKTSMLSDYMVLEDNLIVKGNEEHNWFKSESHEEARKLLSHVIKREYLLLMYMYLAEFMRCHDVSDEDYESVKGLIWNEIYNIK